MHFAATAHPTAEWTAQQVREAFPWESAPHYLPRDRDHIYGHDFVEQVEAMRIKQVLSVPRSPWQRAYIERLIGTIRRECLDHLIVFDERSLCHHLRAFCDYYHRSRTHLALDTDSPETRAIQRPEAGRIISIPGGWRSPPSLRTLRSLTERRACMPDCSGYNGDGSRRLWTDARLRMRNDGAGP